MQGILAKRHYWLAALLVLLLSVTLAACDTNGTNGNNGTPAPDGEEGINAESQGDSDEEPFEIQEVPGSGDGTTSGTDGDAVAQSPEGEATPGGEAAGTVTADEGTPTAEATSQAGQDGDAQMIADCFETDPHPIGEAIAADFDVSYNEVMGWMCEGSSFEDILLALQTSELSGRPAGEILDEVDSRSWSLIWQEDGLVPSGADDDADDAPDLATTPTPGAQDGDTPGAVETPAPGAQATPAPGAQATPGAGTDDDDDDDTSMSEQDGEGQLVFEDGAMQWTDDEFELTGIVVAKDEANRTIDVRARNEDDANQIYAFAVGENGIFDEVEEGDRVRVTGERLDDGTVVAYAMEVVATGTGGTDGQDGDAQDDMSAGVSTLAPGEIEFRGTIVSTDPDERSFELQLAQASTGPDVRDDTFTSPLTPTSPATGSGSDDLDDSDAVTGTNGLDDSDVVTGTNGLDDSDADDLDQMGWQQSYTFYVPESLAFDAFGMGDVIEVEIEPLDAGLSGDQDAQDDITGTNGIIDTEPLTGTGTMTGTDSLDLSDDDSATGDDSDMAGDDDSATGDGSGLDLGGIVDDLLDGDDQDAQARESWRMVEFELMGTVEAVDEAAGTIDVRVLYGGGQEETYTFAVRDDENLSLYREGGSVEIEVQLEATAAEIGQREVLNGDLGDADDDADATDSLFAQQPLGLGAGEFEFRGTIVSVDATANSFDLLPDARYTQDMDQIGTGTGIITGTDGLDDTDSMAGTNGLDDDADSMAGTDEITGTNGLDDTDSITGTNGLDDDTDSMAGTNGTAGQGQLDLYTMVLPQGADIASFSEGDVVEVEIEPVPTGGLFGLNGQDDLDLDDDQDDVDLGDDQADTDTEATQDDTDTGTSASPLGGDDDQDDQGQDGMAQPDAATMMASIELRGEVVAVDEEAGTIDVRLTPMDDMTGTNGLNGLTDDDSSGLAPTDSITATGTVTGTDDMDDSDADDSDLDDSDADDSDLSPLGQADGEEILTFYIADESARRYYQPGTLVEIEIDLEERADMDGDADASAGGQFCATAAGEHPLADAIAESYGADVDEIRGWYCEDNLGFGEIMLALTTADVSGEPVEDLASRRVDNESWGEIWQDLDLITRIEDAGEMDDRLSDD